MRLLQNNKKGWCFGTALFFVWLLASRAAADGMEKFAVFESQMVSEVEPIKATFKNWGSELHEGERQWARALFEIGGSYRGFELAVQQRVLADVRITPEAADFYGRVERKEALTAGEQADVQITVNGFSAQGFRLGYVKELRDWNIGASAVVFQARHLMAGTLDGTFTALSETDYDFEAAVDYVYYRDPIFKRENLNTPTGIGWSLHLQGEWAPTEKLRFAFRADDLLTKIKWRDVPFTVADAHTRQKAYDEDGFAVFNPLFSGRQGYKESYQQEVDPSYRADAVYLAGRWSAHWQGQYQFDDGISGLGAGYLLKNSLHVTTMYWPELEAIGLKLNRAMWTAGLTLDHFEWHKLQALGVYVAYGY